MSEDNDKNDPHIETEINTLKLNNNNNNKEENNNNNPQKRRNSKKKSSKRKKQKKSVAQDNNNIDNKDGLIIVSNEIIEVKDKTKTKVDNFAEHNISIRNIIENALFSQLSEIKVFLLD